MTDPRYLFDSNACIYVIEGLSGALRQRVEACDPGEIVTSSIVYAEVLRGFSPQDAQTIARGTRLFDVVPVLPFDEHAARAYAKVPFKRGHFDRLIAAHALALGLTIVTSNLADFSDVPGLRVEDWTA
ncbi:MAG: type II toxin-antitoxin system VapC family toxin [Sphingomicrobium sp.]